MKGGDEKARKYIYTFIRDFFAISNESLKFFYNINKTSITDEVDRFHVEVKVIPPNKIW